MMDEFPLKTIKSKRKVLTFKRVGSSFYQSGILALKMLQYYIHLDSKIS